MESLWQDAVFGARIVRKDKLFAVVALATLAIGIGANTAVFSLLNALLWRSLPVRVPEQLVRLRVTNLPPTDRAWVNGRAVAVKERDRIPFALYESLAKHEAFQGVFGVAGVGKVVAEIDGTPQQLRMSTVTGSYFPVLGVAAGAGRLLAPSDDVPGGGAEGWSIVISDALWARVFGRSAAAIGMKIRMEQVPFTIVGVAERRFHGVHPGEDPEVWMPVSSLETLYPKWRWRTDSGAWMMQTMARVKPGIGVAEAARGLGARSHALLEQVKPPGLAAEDEKHFLALKLEAVPAGSGYSALAESFGAALWTLMGAVGAVLLIAATNLTNLVIARGTARRQEIAVRLALGAPLARIRRQLVVEHALLAGMGTGLGILLARWIQDALLRGVAANAVLEAPTDWRVLGFAACLLVVVVVVAGWAPAWSVAGSAIHSTSKRHGTRETSWLRSGLVVVQIALTLVMLGGAGLLTVSLRSLLGESTGFDTANSLFVTPDLFNAGVHREKMPEVYERILNETRRLPGVRSAGWTLHMPLTGGLQAFTVELPGRPDLPPKERFVFSHQVTDGYFAAAGVPLLAGRDFARRGANGPAGSIVSRNFALRFFGTVEKAIGQRMKPGNLGWTEIIGVAADAKFSNVKEPEPYTVYTSYWDQKTALGMTLVANHEGRREPLVSALRTLLETVAARKPFLRVRTLPENISNSVAMEKLLASVLSSFAGFALVISVTGIAGMLSYLVQLKRREIGIRLALGATPERVARREWRYGLALTAAGLLLGGVLSYWLRTALSSFLFHVEAGTWTVWGAVCGVLLIAGAVASWIPARRGARLDPMAVLRME
ncbi:MAG: ABC transporter permease [Acidobacteria bacterium]|nr:ABC transporter permease [Acidobacteriota bacterium]